MAKEKIGNVVLNLDYYPGQDFYSDGTIEDEILEIAKNFPEEEFAGIIEEKKLWPIMYHLSNKRENIVDCLPIKKTDKVLEVGSGCGAITGALSRKAAKVDCVDLSKKRSMVNAYRHKDCDNVEIHLGNFKDVEPSLPDDYDYICLIGVFEYGQNYIGGQTPYEDFLKILLKHLKKDGRIVIAIENKLGMKYFAGCKEDHLGTFFSGIENAYEGEGVQTFSRPGLEQIFKACGVSEYSFYYPYPDYKFPVDIYSDERLPKVGELINNKRNFDRDRMQLFDEAAAFNSVIEDGLFPVFSNSYMAILGPKIDMTYTRYSNDRTLKYQIKTIFVKDGEKLYVRKYPLQESGRKHIETLGTTYEVLKDVFTSKNCQLSPCKVVSNEQECYAEFPYITGVTLEQKLDECLFKHDEEGFLALFKRFFETIKCGEETNYTNFDMAFSNFLIDKDQWTLLDYEWVFTKKIPAKKLAYRAIYCYMLEDEQRCCLPIASIEQMLDITEEEIDQIKEEEAVFQKDVTGKRLSMAELRNLIGGAIINPTNWLKHFDSKGGTSRVQIYEDCGHGYSENDSYFISDAFRTDTYVEFDISVSDDVKMLRIDPAMDSCIVKVKKLIWNGELINVSQRKRIYINGKAGKGEHPEQTVYVFDTMDPNINLSTSGLSKIGNNQLHVELEVTRVSADTAKVLQESMKSKLF